MPSHILKMTLQEIQSEVAEEIRYHEDLIMRRAASKWTTPLLILMREFHDLATAPHLDPAQIREFIQKLTSHITTARLKGFDHLIWYAQTLEHLANAPTNTDGP